jgi:type I restriction-modification system DNA methylase subunit
MLVGIKFISIYLWVNVLVCWLGVLSDTYEYLIGKFASGAGKKAGEFYTPQQVRTVLALLVTVDKTKLKSVHDPTCGSGSLLLRVAKEVKEVSAFYGQESNPTTYNASVTPSILQAREIGSASFIR